MCGILGIIHYSYYPPTYRRAGLIRDVARNLLVKSECRGRDASGLCTVGDKKASVYKINLPASEMISQKGYSDVIGTIRHGHIFRAMIGHTRAKTKGSEKYNVNNHPIVANKVVGVHNGVIGNDDMIFKQQQDLARRGEVDSEVIFRLIDNHIQSGRDIAEAVTLTHAELIGSYACAFVHTKKPSYVTLFKDSWSPIHLYIYDKQRLMIFASAVHILAAALHGIPELAASNCTSELEIPPNTGIRIDTDNGKIYEFELGEGNRYHYAERSGI